MTDTELLNELEQRAEAYHYKIKKDFAIEELEKIRNEITMLLFFNRENVVEVIDNHIEKLKGEQE